MKSWMQQEHPAVCWLGNAGWLMAAQGHLIATDLDLHLPERALPPYDDLPQLVARLEYLFITHGHADHFNPETVDLLMKGGACRCVLPESCRTAAQDYGLDFSRILFTQPLPILRDRENNPMKNPGIQYDLRGVLELQPWLRVQPLRAIHGHEKGMVYAGANPQDCGYSIDFCGLRYVQPGDTVLLEEHLDITGIDVLFLSTTQHTMGTQHAAHWVRAVRPERIFAQHFGTYYVTEENAFWTTGHMDEVKAALPPELAARCIIPEYNTPYPLQGC